MALKIVEGQIQKKKSVVRKPKKPPNIAPGVTLGGVSFFTSTGDGDLDDYLKSLRHEKGFRTVTLDTRFYVLWKLKRKLQGHFTIKAIREYIQNIPNQHTQKKIKRCVLCYAIFRNQQGDPSLLGGILSDPELRPKKLHM